MLVVGSQFIDMHRLVVAVVIASRHFVKQLIYIK